MPRRFILLGLTFAALAAACGGDTAAPPPPAVSVVITAARDSVYVKDKLTVSIAVTGTPVTRTLVSSNTTVLTVQNGNVVTGKSPGRAWLIAIADEARDSISLLVVDSVRALRLSADSVRLKTGYSMPLTATLLDANNQPLTGRIVTWSSSDPATVISSQLGPSGGVLAARTGTARIIAQSEGKADTAIVTVLPRAVRVVFQPASATLAAGDSVHVTVTAVDSSGAPDQSPGAVTFSTTNAPSIVFDGAGYLHAYVAQRTSNLVATTPDVSGSMPVTTGTMAFTSGITGGSSTWCGRAAGAVVFCSGNVNTAGEYGNPYMGTVNLNGVTYTVQALVPTLQGLGRALERTFCGVTASGDAWCWGLNVLGTLAGANNTSNPFRVLGVTGLTSIGTGISHACALSSAGAVTCWGSGTRGQLGNGSNAAPQAPVPVAPGTVFTQIAVGGNHSCALRTDSLAMCWGDNGGGQVGDSTINSTLFAPVLVAGNHRFIAIAAGRNHSCGLAADSTAWCWGGNDRGQLGTSALGSCAAATGTCSNVPVHAAGPHQKIVLGNGTTCGLSNVGVLSCWGNVNGATTVLPVGVDPARQYVDASATPLCGQIADGHVYCYVLNSWQLAPGQQ